MILLIFDLQVGDLILHTISGQEKSKIAFQDGHHGSRLGFPIGTSFAIFESFGLSVQEKKQNRFQDDGHGGHLEFPIRKI